MDQSKVLQMASLQNQERSLKYARIMMAFGFVSLTLLSINLLINLRRAK